ncbi:MAG: DUF4189 domain-containing protein, partial [Candidatus Magnetominusculus sp. LBB02]|nr:DUF4189 domain-containing protein [Candidatus Magnetominusculus sp. LBB02]
MKNVVYLLALALIVGMCFSGNVYATGAIAISDEDELYGFCSGKDGKDEAKACALKACKNGGGSNCKFRVWF